MRHPESDLQIACVRWFRHQYPKVLIFAVPNGGKRNAREAARMKAEGTTAGVPDLFIASPRGGYGGLFIEMKAGKGKLTEAQEEMHDRLVVDGYVCDVCRTLESFQKIVQGYLSQPSFAASGNDAVQLLSS